MKKKVLALLAALALATSSPGDIFTPGGDAEGGGGGFSGGVVPLRTTFGSAVDAANAVDLNETAGCITFEGSGADANETRLCAQNPGLDSTWTFNAQAAAYTAAGINVAQTWTAAQTFGGRWSGATDINVVTTTATTAANDSFELYTNTGDTDGATITLQDNPTAGVSWDFAVTVAQTLTIVPSAGETLNLGADNCVVSITSNTVGSTLTIRAITGGSGAAFYVWGSATAAGVWVCNDV